jgi:hypothetical protein
MSFYVQSSLGRRKMKHTTCMLHDQGIEGYVGLTAEKEDVTVFPL